MGSSPDSPFESLAMRDSTLVSSDIALSPGLGTRLVPMNIRQGKVDLLFRISHLFDLHAGEDHRTSPRALRMDNMRSVPRLREIFLDLGNLIVV